jgi:LCP family protein required for cell wall assembly
LAPDDEPQDAAPEVNKAEPETDSAAAGPDEPVEEPGEPVEEPVAKGDAEGDANAEAAAESNATDPQTDDSTSESPDDIDEPVPVDVSGLQLDADSSDEPISAAAATTATAAATATATAEELKDRASHQASLRKERKKAKKHKHRWLRRTMYAFLALIVLVAGAGAGLYFYAGYRFDQIKKIHAKHLVKQAAPGKPFNMLLVGSDSRAFVENATQIKAFGSASAEGGQRSDVTMIARFVPATKSITILSVPRDLWVDIPSNSSDISGLNRINAAFNSGPDLLVETIEKVLHIQINHYMSVGFQGFNGMVTALGGVTMDFPTEVKDDYTGLNITTPGCQVVNGTVALQLVRSRHLQYKNSDGYWEYDGLSDFSRIQRQDAFFRAVLAKVNTSLHNPFAINGFISAAVGNLTIDDTLSKTDLFHLATEFKGLQTSHLVTETLPTKGYVTDGGADVLLAAQPYADNMIKAFNQIGLPKPKPKPPATKAPTLAHNLVDVQVFNANAVSGMAHDTAAALTSAGYDVTEIGDAPTTFPAGKPEEIWYGPTGEEAAHTLGASLLVPITYVSDPSLTGNTVALFVVGSTLSVKPSATTGTSSTTTTYPGEPTTTTTIPGDVYTNKQQEPWNPVPCTLK